MIPGYSMGLTEVGTDDLKRALSHLHKGEFDIPVAPWGLARIGLQHVQTPLLDALRNLDAAGVHAVLVCVLAERAAAERRAGR